jgi:hypothetical protein
MVSQQVVVLALEPQVLMVLGLLTLVLELGGRTV